MIDHSIYTSRIFDTIKYIDQHVDEDLSLEKLASKAFCSNYHFHRLFRAATGESLNSFVVRKRIEKASAILIRDRYESIQNISYRCGFNDNFAFTKAFKKQYQLSPTTFRKKYKSRFDKVIFEDSKIGQMEAEIESYLCNVDHLKKYIMENGNVEVMDLPQLRFASFDHIGVDAIF